VTRVVEDGDLDEAALETARDLAAGPTVALSLIRKTLWASYENTYENQLHTERVLQKQAGLTEDFVEGVTAFLKKRKAEFKGQ
jgi:2-(1,2-epoxy-1,2-dihydrophenyl)acetyl-CoA isomerase